MGYLRALFAINVAIGHGWPGDSIFVGGKNAVQLFYMISGFLISYVLVEKQSYASVANFYISRMLRIFPIYLIVALAALAFLASTNENGFLDVYRNAPTVAAIWLALSNLLLLGQDWLLFTAVHDGALHFSTNFYLSELPLYRGLLVPQAWSLGVELTFYAIAPFILTSKRKMVALFLASLALRIYLLRLGFGGDDPWSYRFFPTELALFLAGALSHQILLPIYREYASIRIPALATSAFFFLSIAYPAIPIQDPIKASLFLALFAISMPLFFMFSSSNKLDTAVGNLSYPIYICHLLVLWILERMMPMSNMLEKKIWSITGVIASIALAYLLDRFVGEHVEILRARNRR